MIDNKKFIDFLSKGNIYSFKYEEQLQLFENNSNVSYLYTFKDWNGANNWITRGEKGIQIGTRPEKYFDLSQTKKHYIKTDLLFSRLTKEEINNDLKNEFINDRYNSYKQEIKNAMSYILSVRFENNKSVTISNEDLERITDDDLAEISALSKKLMYVIHTEYIKQKEAFEIVNLNKIFISLLGKDELENDDVRETREHEVRLYEDESERIDEGFNESRGVGELSNELVGTSNRQEDRFNARTQKEVESIQWNDSESRPINESTGIQKIRNDSRRDNNQRDDRVLNVQPKDIDLDVLKNILKQNNNSHLKEVIYSYVISDLNINDKAKYINDLYNEQKEIVYNEMVYAKYNPLGLDIHQNKGEDKIHSIIKWTKLTKLIDNFISLDDYLNTDEKEYYNLNKTNEEFFHKSFEDISLFDQVITEVQEINSREYDSYDIKEETDINSDIKRYLISNGTGFIDGKYRVVYFIENNRKDIKFSNFLKNEFGTGGSGYDGISVQYDPSGLKYYDNNKDISANLNWSEISNMVKELIDSNTYLSNDEREYYESCYRTYQKEVEDISIDEALVVANYHFVYDYIGKADGDLNLEQGNTLIDNYLNNELFNDEYIGSLSYWNNKYWNKINLVLKNDRTKVKDYLLINNFKSLITNIDINTKEHSKEKILYERLKNLFPRIENGYVYCGIYRNDEDDMTLTISDFSEINKEDNYQTIELNFIKTDVNSIQELSSPCIIIDMDRANQIAIPKTYIEEIKDSGYTLDQDNIGIIDEVFNAFNNFENSNYYLDHETTNINRFDNVYSVDYYEDKVVNSSMSYPILLDYCKENGLEIHDNYNIPKEYLNIALDDKEIKDEEIREEDDSFPYKIGDKVKIDDIEYDITEIRNNDVQLLDKTLVYPIFRVESKENFLRLIDMQSNDLTITKDEKEVNVENKSIRPINYVIDDDEIGVGTPKERYKNNIEAIKLLFILEKENRNATSEEQHILANYVGWGGLSDVFDETKTSWSNEYKELKELLNDEEYKSARESVLSAYYTDPVIIEAIYKALDDFGFERGNILEPSCGVGNFFGKLPDKFKDSQLYGVELDSISSRIAKKLYPLAHIENKGYEETNFNDNFFDVAIGNVPFGDFKVQDKKFDKYNFQIHDYFFAKTIDKVRPNGVIAFVTSKGTMDKLNSKARAYISERCDLIGAIRLPNDSFKRAAGTDVVSDIIFLSKREKLNPIESEWVKNDDVIFKVPLFDNKIYGKEQLNKELLSILFDDDKKELLVKIQKALNEHNSTYYDYRYNQTKRLIDMAINCTISEEEFAEGIKKDGEIWNKINNRYNKSYALTGEYVYQYLRHLYKTNADEEELLKSLNFNNREMNRYYDNNPKQEYLNVYLTIVGDLLKDDKEVSINNYFINNPDMIAGDYDIVTGRFGNEIEISRNGKELKDLLAERIEKLDYVYEEINQVNIEDLEEATNKYIQAKPHIQNYTYGWYDHKIYYRDNSVMFEKDSNDKDYERVKGLLTIRMLVKDIFAMQLRDCGDEELRNAQKVLNIQYDNFIEKYGYIDTKENEKAFNADTTFNLLSSLELYDKDGNYNGKSAIFTDRTISKPEPITHCDTSNEALTVSFNARGKVDLEYMAELTSKNVEEVVSDLNGIIFLDPSDKIYKTRDEYLSGDVKTKLAIVEENLKDGNSEYAINKEALLTVIPKDLTAEEIDVRLGATWIPTHIIEDFMSDVLMKPSYSNITVDFSPVTGEWKINNKQNNNGNPYVTKNYGLLEKNAYQILEDLLNLRDTKIYKTIYEDGKEKRVIDQKKTILVQQKAEALKMEFDSWVFNDPTRRYNLEKIYNDRFNRIVPRTFDGNIIKPVGQNVDISLYKHQLDAVARGLYGGNTLLAHVVGAGKTWTMVTVAMEAKRLGLSNKSMFVVPNHLIKQWQNEFLELYPNANILAAQKEDFTPKQRKRFCSKIATGNYDAIIIGHSQFEKIPLSHERQVVMLEKQIEEIVNYIAEESNGNRFTVKQLESAKKKLENRLEKLNKQDYKDQVVTFEELGVDRLFVDEAHLYKNLFLYTKLSRVAGVQTTEAMRSTDLFNKCVYLNEINNNSGIVFATGTPIANSMTELYTMQRYLQLNTLKDLGLDMFDSWAANFGEITTSMELKPEGTGYQAKTRFSKFFNLPELMNIFKEIADVQTSDMLNLNVPKANYHNIAIKPSADQKDYVKELAERAEIVRNNGVDPSKDNMLSITNDGRKLALDQRLVGLEKTEGYVGKIQTCVENVYRIYQERNEDKGTQLIFCDLSTPSNTWNVYDEIKKELIELGVPEKEIEFIHNANNDVKKDKLFKKVRSGSVRILLGTTQKLGAGTNIQDNMVALHHLDVPWRPADIEQQEGRIIRQGNKNQEVDIYRYVTEGTFDAYSWQVIENKQKFISQIMTSKEPTRTMDDFDEAVLSAAEVKALATDNPYIKEKMQLDSDVTKLKLLKSNYKSQLYSLQNDVNINFPKTINKLRHEINNIDEDIRDYENREKPSLIIDNEGKEYLSLNIELNGKQYDSYEEAGKVMDEIIKDILIGKEKNIGKYMGYNVYVGKKLDYYNSETYIKLVRKHNIEIKAYQSSIRTLKVITNSLSNIYDVKENLEAKLQSIELNLDKSKALLDKPFEKEEELKQKLQRLTELNTLLDGTKNDEEEIDEVDIIDEIDNCINDMNNFDEDFSNSIDDDFSI